MLLCYTDRQLQSGGQEVLETAAYKLPYLALPVMAPFPCKQNNTPDYL